MIWSTERGPDGDTDAWLGARDGGGRAGAGPAEFARQHDVPAALVAEGVGARSDLRAVASPLLCRRARRLPHGRRRQGVRRHPAGRHAHRRPARAEGVPRPWGSPGRPKDLRARPDAGGQVARRRAPGDAPARHGGRPGADVAQRPTARRRRPRSPRRRGVERVRRDREAGPQSEGQVTTGRSLAAASAWALAAALLLAGCSDSAAGKPARSAAPPAVPVTAADAVEKTVPIQLTAVGNAMAYTTVGIKSQINGQIVEVHFKEGQEVRKGDLLFIIDPRPIEAALRQAEAAGRQRQAEVQQAIANLERDTAQLANARVQERRYKELVEKELVAREQYDQLHTNLAAMDATVQADRAAIENAKASERAAQANVDNAKLQLAYTEIHAPIEGRTGNLLVQNGNVIKANDDNPLVVINQVQPIYVSFSVPEQYLADIKKYRAAGQLRVEVRPPHQSQTLATGELTFINNAVDQTTGTIQLKATFANRDNALWPGQFLDVALTLTSRTAIVVPSQAIQPGQQGPFIFVVKADATVESRQVVPGTRLGAETIIEEGLRAGERNVIDGQLRLVPGAKVEIRPAKAS